MLGKYFLHSGFSSQKENKTTFPIYSQNDCYICLHNKTGFWEECKK